MTNDQSIIVLLGAVVLDYSIGDPWSWLHPVQVMGWVINRFTQVLKIKECDRPLQQRGLGILLGLILIIGSGASGWAISYGSNLIHPLFGIVTQSVILASCFALKSLRQAAETVLQVLATGNVEQSRISLSQYVGRDTENLTESGILRAVMETVTENSTDGVMAPLFYAIFGAFTPFGSVPFALAYKAASTLDSMIGYREAPYTYLGWFSAKLEDYLTWLPCRLTVLTLALLSGKPRQVWQICCRDAVKDASPNSGWSEGAYAAVLGVQVGGINWYQGVAKPKPLIGDSIYPITPALIYQALQLTQSSFLVWLLIAIALLLVNT
ncbi:adenosylcobinamide-phosphate synthase CbiB [Chlorogloea sp. CCALA 695]|uniref:adenosylcobinamide-phosphate synthase CbiB n=1 Tax=Chlorogloea sp. CCALA 695 TaxID=2107693 RepID=UPI000D075291|nr:adenosylcobinamide-phosphate synthase CbiB [Chlorogloea sp. CCALA 695]PSB32367.1 cobalamin biosynthesis protein [Chlorogloea sp. CCALA 695]